MKGQKMIELDVWLYGSLAEYGTSSPCASSAGPGFAHLEVPLPTGSSVADLLEHLAMPTEKRGITFINARLSAMPGLQPDLDHGLESGDRIAFFHLRSMWPYQYRDGAGMIPELAQAVSNRQVFHSRSRETDD